MAYLPMWPASLPPAPLLADYGERYTSLATSVTTGNKSLLIRRSGTRAQDRLSVAFLFNMRQVDYFEQFYYDVLDGGANRFLFEHPRKRIQIECSFDPTNEEGYTIVPIEQLTMSYFKMATTFIVWN